jgi:hypothetical protein
MRGAGYAASANSTTAEEWQSQPKRRLESGPEQSEAMA